PGCGNSDRPERDDGRRGRARRRLTRTIRAQIVTMSSRSAPGSADVAGCAQILDASPSALGEQPAVLELGLEVVGVHLGDDVDADLLGAGRLALAVVGARAEELLHRLHHRLRA